MSASGSRKPRSRLSVVVLAPLVAVCGVAVLALLAWGMYDAFQEESAGVASSGKPAATPLPVTAEEVEAAFSTALSDGVMADDRAAWRTALPARGKAKAGLTAIWEHLAPLDWGELAADVTATPGEPGVFDVRITGTPGGAGPDDRIVAERVLAFEHRAAGTPDGTTDDEGAGAAVNGGSGGRIVAVGDRSPVDTRRQYLMALNRPRMLERDGVVVVYEASWKPVAEQVAALVPEARAKVAAELGERIGKPVVSFVYSSGVQVGDYLADPKFDKRVRFFSRIPTTVSRRQWAPSDVAVVGPEADEVDLRAVVTHEVTHSLTSRRFFDTRTEPLLLLEGMAVSVAAERSYLALRDDLADGSLKRPLLGSFALDDVWQGNDLETIELVYLEGGATVGYILDTWGSDALWRFSLAVADSALARSDVKRAVREELGVDWDEFYAGWVDYIDTLP